MIKEYISLLLGDSAMLVDDTGMPLHFANRYAFSFFDSMLLLS